MQDLLFKMWLKKQNKEKKRASWTNLRSSDPDTILLANSKTAEVMLQGSDNTHTHTHTGLDWSFRL